MTKRNADKDRKTNPPKRTPARTSKKLQQLRTIEQFFKLPPRTQEVWNNVAHVISEMRSGGASLYQASRKYGVDPRTVIHRGSSALRKLPNGRYVAKSRDQLLRILYVPSPEGPREVVVRDSRHATRLAKYWNAVHRYLRKEDDSALRKLRKAEIKDADGKVVPLITNLDELDRLGNAGVLSFEYIYAR